MFQRNLLPPSSGYEIVAAAISKALVILYRITWHHIPESSILQFRNFKNLLQWNVTAMKMVNNMQWTSRQVQTEFWHIIVLSEKNGEKVYAHPHVCHITNYSAEESTLKVAEQLPPPSFSHLCQTYGAFHMKHKSNHKFSQTSLTLKICNIKCTSCSDLPATFIMKNFSAFWVHTELQWKKKSY